MLPLASTMKRTAKLIAITALIAATVVAVKLATTPSVGTKFERANAPIWGLPANASEINFVMRPFSPVIAYNFATDESSFVDWSQHYLGLDERREGHVSIQDIDPLSGAANTIECPDGIEYNWSEEDRGQYTMFDRTRQRAYYFSQTR